MSSVEEGVLITHAGLKPLDSEILFVNNGLCGMTGYIQKELIWPDASPILWTKI
jgi:hypothetical protein